MLRTALVFLSAVAATPALAATGPFFSLSNSDFVVTIAFVLFAGILIYFKVPGMLMGMLDKRAEGIERELGEARALRDEAQSLLASYERKAREVEEHAGRIVAQAKEEAEIAAQRAKEDLQESIARRIKAAEDQIASAETAAVKEVRDRAVEIAIAAAGTLISAKMGEAEASALTDAAISEVAAKLH
ncbi:MAG: F0F1 ATP synthase subunit B [Pseudomonadota bacterium]